MFGGLKKKLQAAFAGVTKKEDIAVAVEEEKREEVRTEIAKDVEEMGRGLKRGGVGHGHSLAVSKAKVK